MITVGVRDLKNRLSRYLQYVKDGEKVIITEHNKIIAEINLPGASQNLSSIEETLKQLSKEGDIILAKRQSTCAALPEAGEKLDWVSAYNETRADRL
ncbi:MAG: type II toxin-antitoxin system prevent-host-death family antitoxin [Treponema sp.]|nr:type II toxin-antitoxin system prevent-host-death family antitoxin [Treponema sp.]